MYIYINTYGLECGPLDYLPSIHNPFTIHVHILAIQPFNVVAVLGQLLQFLLRELFAIDGITLFVATCWVNLFNGLLGQRTYICILYIYIKYIYIIMYIIDWNHGKIEVGTIRSANFWYNMIIIYIYMHILLSLCDCCTARAWLMLHAIHLWKSGCTTDVST